MLYFALFYHTNMLIHLLVKSTSYSLHYLVYFTSCSYLGLVENATYVFPICRLSLMLPRDILSLNLHN